MRARDLKKLKPGHKPYEPGHVAIVEHIFWSDRTDIRWYDAIKLLKSFPNGVARQVLNVAMAQAEAHCY